MQKEDFKTLVTNWVRDNYPEELQNPPLTERDYYEHDVLLADDLRRDA